MTTVQRLAVIGDPLLCWRCNQPATVMLSKKDEHETGAYSQIGYCDTCWIGETRAYSPLVARDEQLAGQAVAALFGDDDQKAGVKAS